MHARMIEVDRLKAQLQLWDAEMAHLEEKVGHLEPDYRSALENEAHDTLQAMLGDELARLRQMWTEAEQVLHLVEQADDHEWQIVWERAERALDRLGEAFAQSRARFGE